MSTTKNIIFRLLNDEKPISWQLPLEHLLLPKIVDGIAGAEKHVHYIKGASTIYVEDYKGDKKPEQVVFEDGELEVRPTDFLLLELLRRHPWMGKKYFEVNEEKEAKKSLEIYELRDKANALINKMDEIELSAASLAILGEGSIHWGTTMCKAKLKERAYENPIDLINEMETPDYENRYLVSLAIMKKIIRVNPSNTAVVWGDTENVIVRIAVGENPITRMAEFLSGSGEEVSITKQRLGELIEKLTKSVFKEAAQPVAPVVQEATTDVDTTDTGSFDASLNSDEVYVPGNEYTIEELKAFYVSKFKQEVPNNMKNNSGWIVKQLNL
jgi:hypothetical protein